jgi:hypothetical protein
MRIAGDCLMAGCATAQAANVLHDAFEEPGRVLWRKVSDHWCAILTLAMQRPWTACLIVSSVHSCRQPGHVYKGIAHSFALCM